MKLGVQFGKGAHADLAMYDLDLTALGYDIKVEDGTWAETYDVVIAEIEGLVMGRKFSEEMGVPLFAPRQE